MDESATAMVTDSSGLCEGDAHNNGTYDEAGLSASHPSSSTDLQISNVQGTHASHGVGCGHRRFVLGYNAFDRSSPGLGTTTLDRDQSSTGNPGQTSKAEAGLDCIEYNFCHPGVDRPRIVTRSGNAIVHPQRIPRMDRRTTHRRHRKDATRQRAGQRKVFVMRGEFLHLRRRQDSRIHRSIYNIHQCIHPNPSAARNSNEQQQLAIPISRLTDLARTTTTGPSNSEGGTRIARRSRNARSRRGSSGLQKRRLESHGGIRLDNAASTDVLETQRCRPTPSLPEPGEFCGRGCSSRGADDSYAVHSDAVPLVVARILAGHCWPQQLKTTDMATEFDLPLHLKQLPRRADWERCAECIIPELRNTWEYARACLTDAAFIRRQTQGHCPPQLSEALLSKEDIKRLIGHGIIEENVGEVLGTCRVFSVLELTS